MTNFTRTGLNQFLRENGGNGLSKKSLEKIFKSYLNGGPNDAFVSLTFKELEMILLGNGAGLLSNEVWEDAYEKSMHIEVTPDLVMREVIYRIYDTIEEGDHLLYIMLKFLETISEQHFWVFENALSYVLDWNPNVTPVTLLQYTIERLEQLAIQLDIADLAPVRPPYREVAIKTPLIWLEYYAKIGSLVSEEPDSFLGIPRPIC